MRKNKIAFVFMLGAAMAVIPVLDADASTCSTLKAALIIDEGRLEYVPREPKCVAPNNFIVIRLIPAGSARDIQKGTVKTEGVASNPQPDDWLDATNDGPEGSRYKIKLTVPAGTQADVYKFTITVPDVGVLDPVVRVVDVGVYKKTFEAEAKRFGPEALDELVSESE